MIFFNSLSRGPIHIHLTRQNVILTLCVQPTHPLNIMSKVKPLKKFTHNPLSAIYIQDSRLSYLFLLLSLLKWTVKTMNQIRLNNTKNPVSMCMYEFLNFLYANNDIESFKFCKCQFSKTAHFSD